MAALVTLARAKEHLRITADDSNADIQSKVEQASSIIVEYLDTRADSTWTPDTVTGPVQAAVLLLVAHLYEHRGDDLAIGGQPDTQLWEAIGRLLVRSRDPALA